MIAPTSETQQAQEGSIEWYRRYSGSFVHSLIDCIERADSANKRRLRRAFPQVVAALEMYSWYVAPPGWEPYYNAEAQP